MKIGFDLTLNQYLHEGITRYSIEIVKHMVAYDTLNQYIGYAFAPYFKKKKLNSFYEKLYPQLEMKISNSWLPMKYMLKAHHNPFALFFKDSIINNDNDVMIYFYNSLYKCKTKAKRILVLHDIIPIYNIKVPYRNYKKYLKHTIKSINNSDLIVTVSEYSKMEILKYFPEAKNKIIIAYDGVDTAPYKKNIPDEKYAEVKNKYNLNKKYFIFIGQPRENKNLSNLIKAYNLLPEEIKKEYDLVLANSNEKLEDLVRGLGIGENVKLLHGFDEGDKAALLKMSSALCLVSTLEGFGIPIIEAMAAGTPVVTSNVSCMPEVAGGAARLVDPFDIKSIADGIENVLTDEKLRAELIEKGYRRAEFFTWDNAAKSFAEGLQKLKI